MYKVFVKEVPIIVTTNPDAYPDYEQFKLKKVKLEKIVRKIHKGKLSKVVLYEKKPKKLLKRLHKKLPLVLAAGGLVINEENKSLFIHRNGKWDIPKGKMDAGETMEQTALREVAEETGVRDHSITKYLGPTYHVFSWKHKTKLKLTHWYMMDTTFKGELIPQAKENIDKAVWLSHDEAQEALKDSYGNIRELFPDDMVLENFRKV